MINPGGWGGLSAGNPLVGLAFSAANHAAASPGGRRFPRGFFFLVELPLKQGLQHVFQFFLFFGIHVVRMTGLPR
jgi:hypothetical protein